LSRVLRADQVPAGAGSFNLSSFEREAEAIMARARQRAEEIVAAAGEEAGRLREDARRSGMESGLAEGREKGLEEGRRGGREEGLAACREDTATLAESVGKMVAELSAGRAALIKEAEKDLLELSVKIAERVVRRELKLDRSAAARAAAEAIGLAAEPSRVTVRVNPRDLAAVKEAHADLARRFAEVEDISLVGDEQIERGGCRVITAAGEVDMDVSTQLERISRLLVGGAGDQG
jgi:flagellar assembly protein FliH